MVFLQIFGENRGGAGVEAAKVQAGRGFASSDNLI